MAQRIKILTSLASLISIGFGVWHFFVPKIWNWYAYMDTKATELAIAVQAINVFFSLCLVLMGLMNIILIWYPQTNRFSMLVVLGASIILWGTRVIMQAVYPQGTMNPTIQYSMLITFLFVTGLYLVSFLLIFEQKTEL